MAQHVDDEAAENNRMRPWRWPAEWVRDEKFWRDVATRTASGILVVAISYHFAVFMGYIQNPGVWNSIGAFISSVAVTSGVGLIAGFLAAAISVVFHRITRKSNKQLAEATAHLQDVLDKQRKAEEEV